MGRQIIKQPDGNYCVFSDCTDSFIAYDGTRDEIVNFFVEEAAKRRRADIKDILDNIDANMPERSYYQFTMTYEQAKKLHDKYESEMK